MKTVPGLDHNPAACEPGIQDELLDRLERFDLAWRNGTPPRIDVYLEAVEAHGCAAGMAPPRSRLLAELVKIDMEYRWRVDESAARDREARALARTVPRAFSRARSGGANSGRPDRRGIPPPTPRG